MIVFWILVWAAVIAAVVVLAVRERRSGRRMAPDAVRQRRDDTFRMRTAAEHYQSKMPGKNPDRD